MGSYRQALGVSPPSVLLCHFRYNRICPLGLIAMPFLLAQRSWYRQTAQNPMTDWGQLLNLAALPQCLQFDISKPVEL